MSNQNTGIFSNGMTQPRQELTAFSVTGVVILVSRVEDLGENLGSGTVYYRIKENLWMTKSPVVAGTGGNLARVTDARLMAVLEKSFTQGYCSAIIEEGGTLTWE